MARCGLQSLLLMAGSPSAHSPCDPRKSVASFYGAISYFMTMDIQQIVIYTHLSAGDRFLIGRVR
jgi:hypothetical protein